MPWPLATDYSAAVQNPATHFRDADLRAGEAAANGVLGLPLAYSGNFATVFKFTSPSNVTWAVKCFTRRVEGLQERYQAISEHLQQQRRRFSVDFVYLPEGVLVNGNWHPVVKMRWVEGFPLNDFLRDHQGAAVLTQLAALWLRLAAELREAQMAHGDLQHGNVLLVPGSKSSSIALRLVDYDGMWVPALDGHPPEEAGHPNYQHPERLASGGYNAEIDRFSHLVIYTSLRALAIGGKTLWDRHDNGENLLFCSNDFLHPQRSPLFADLMTMPDEVLILVGHLLDASRRPLSSVPLLGELTDGQAVASLTAEQIDRLSALIPARWPRPAMPTPTPPTLACPKSDPTLPTVPPPSTRAAASVILATYKGKHPQLHRPPPPPARLPWPPLPDWVPRLGLSSRSWPVRFWPVVLAILMSLPGLTFVTWLLLLGRLR